jgi:COP9 signalosome complex subunit 5
VRLTVNISLQTNANINKELENSVQLLDATRDALYNYDDAAYKELQNQKPWKKDAHYFKHVRISAVALLKMVMHARSGGSIEVMGLMQGMVHGDTFVVTDAFRLPVEATETRVNAQDDAMEYIVKYMEESRKNGQLENAVGWYHSHPGYGCWLSGIDVNTQHNQQLFQDPFLAVVIDPDRTVSAGKVEIGAFRTYPENYKPDSATDSEGFQTIPMEKIQDFGAHADRYYELDVSHYKSSLDTKLLGALWNKYWIGTLSSSPLLTNRDFGTRQIKDLAYKIQDMNHQQALRGGGQGLHSSSRHFDKDEKLEKIVKASNKIEVEERAGIIAAQVKEKVFKVDAKV